ncbi:MAG: hypothetical protein GY862_11710, partial [Gammaproteobacteria bacterium]|nr:hypothetical protein [Gammaproteobacteria bacterium]
HEPTIITRDKGDQAVLLSYADYSALAETAYLLRSPVMVERLRDSLESFQQQKGTEHALIEEVFPSSREQEKITIKLESHAIIELPAKLAKIAESIEESKYILELEKDWDGEGGEKYSYSTWFRAIDFLTKYAGWALNAFGHIIDNPEIFHSENSSIDMLWKTKKYRLLINFPADSTIPASFYGDDFKFDKIKGTFEPSEKKF